MDESGRRVRRATRSDNGRRGGATLPGMSARRDTEVIAKRIPDGRAAVILRDSVLCRVRRDSDRGDQGVTAGRDVDEVRRVDGRITALESPGKLQLGKARAIVPRERRRDTERNHTATHLPRRASTGSWRARHRRLFRGTGPTAIRFHSSRPMSPQQVADVESIVNRGFSMVQVIRGKSPPTRWGRCTCSTRNGDAVRVVSIPE